MSHDIVRDAREDAEDAGMWRRRGIMHLQRILALAEHQLEQDRQALSGPSITLDMASDVLDDAAAITHFKSHFNLSQ